MADRRLERTMGCCLVTSGELQSIQYKSLQFCFSKTHTQHIPTPYNYRMVITYDNTILYILYYIILYTILYHIYIYIYIFVLY